VRIAAVAVALVLLPAAPAAAQEDFPLSEPDRALWRWATVERPTDARATPAADAPVVARLRTRTPEGTPEAVPLLARRAVDGQLWVRVRLPVPPNGTTGWLPRERLGGYKTVRTHLLINLRRSTATLTRAGRRVFRAPVGVGLPQWPTPRGRFYIRNKLVRYRSSFYGPLAFGTSARSAVLTDWPDGGFVGVHGTDRPDLIPGQVSHGCIRMGNRDIVRLGRLMPVGTPVTIR
jgi:lipoprotein-anchoring transpeptidase ErfK/SrfK